jgi:hypothetical protein
MVKWLFSTNAKNIGTLYIIFLIFAGMVGTVFFMLIRLELATTDIMFNLESLYNLKLFPIVECMDDNNISNINNAHSPNPSTNNISNTNDSNPSTGFNININTDGFTVLGEGLKTIGNALNRIHPAVTGAAVGYGAAKILKTLPPAGRVAAVGVVTTAISVTALGSQLINRDSGIQTNTRISNGLNSSAETTLSNQDLALSSDFSSFNSPLEYTNLYDGLILVIILYAIIGLYGIISLIISFLIKELNLESSSFVVARPWLSKYLAFVGASNRVTIFILLVLVGLIFIAILYFAVYLRTHLPPNL